MTGTRTAVLANFGLRTAYGVFMLATPGRVGRPWLGDGAQAAASEVPLRGIGGRELAVHIAGIASVLRGGNSLPWLGASLGGDLTDIAASLADRTRLPSGGLRATVLTGGGSALMTIALIAAAARD